MCKHGQLDFHSLNTPINVHIYFSEVGLSTWFKFLTSKPQENELQNVYLRSNIIRRFKDLLVISTVLSIDFYIINKTEGRPQWPRGLRYEMSPPAQTLGSWIRIPLEAWMSSFILYLCCPVQVAALRLADPPSEESSRLSIRFKFQN
jgi:hypothetical protein